MNCEYEVVIGLEIHLELQTRSKLFCGCSTAFGKEPNSNCCPVCLGLPGSLPVFNRRAIELAVTAALALNSAVQEVSRFDRKNYFYPDLPKAYQVSQYDHPLACGGFLEIELDGESRKIGLERVHLEEEAGKLVHEGDSILSAEYSLVDYNRAGIPLLEIVTAPAISSGSEARIFLEQLRLLMLYSGVSDCKMEEGSLRCDANISLRPQGSTTLGTKAEVKNMNSFKAVEAALNFEARRQREILQSGKKVIQETCHWNEEKKETVPIRSKEGSSDYRYFPEPDLLPLILKPDFIAGLGQTLPERPLERKHRLQQQYGLDEQSAVIMVENKPLGNFFEEAAKSYSDFANLARWVQGDLQYRLREQNRSFESFKSSLLIELLELLDRGEISRPIAKELLEKIISSGRQPTDLVIEKGLGRIADRQQLLPLVEEVIEKNSDAAEGVRQGNRKPLAFLIGQTMARTGGRADPAVVTQLLNELLNQ